MKVDAFLGIMYDSNNYQKKVEYYAVATREKWKNIYNTGANS